MKHKDGIVFQDTCVGGFLEDLRQVKRSRGNVGGISFNGSERTLKKLNLILKISTVFIGELIKGMKVTTMLLGKE